MIGDLIIMIPYSAAQLQDLINIKYVTAVKGNHMKIQ